MGRRQQTLHKKFKWPALGFIYFLYWFSVFSSIAMLLFLLIPSFFFAFHCFKVESYIIYL